MAFDAAGGKIVFDALLELTELRRMRADPSPMISALSPSGALTPAERTAIRARIDAAIDVQRGIIRTEVLSWPP